MYIIKYTFKSDDSNTAHKVSYSQLVYWMNFYLSASKRMGTLYASVHCPVARYMYYMEKKQLCMYNSTG